MECLLLITVMLSWLLQNLSVQCASSVLLLGGQYSQSQSLPHNQMETSFSETTPLASPVTSSFYFTSVKLVFHVVSWLQDKELVTSNVGNCAIVWVCSSSATCSKVSLFDLNSPAECLRSITIAHCQIITIHAVPGNTNALPLLPKVYTTTLFYQQCGPFFESNKKTFFYQ